MQAAGSPVELARNSQIGPYVYPAGPGRVHELAGRAGRLARDVGALRPVAPHDRSLRRGPGRDQAASPTSASTRSRTSRSNKAKQFVACNYDGYVIGDAILFFLAENRVRLVGRPSAHNWVQYHARDGRLRRQARPGRAHGGEPERAQRKLYRFQVQGPTALEVLAKANGGPLPEIKFFNMGELTIGGHTVRALASRHVRRAGNGAVRTVGGGRGRPGRAGRGRQGLRAAPGRLARLRHQHARVRAGSRARCPQSSPARR